MTEGRQSQIQKMFRETPLDQRKQNSIEGNKCVISDLTNKFLRHKFVFLESSNSIHHSEMRLQSHKLLVGVHIGRISDNNVGNMY